MFYLLAWIVLVVFTIQFRRAPFTPWIDTFLLPVLLYVLIENMSGIDRRRLALIIHALLTANALLGLYEFLSGYRLTTYVAGEFIIDTDWRASALLGHPLANALVTGCYVLIIGLGGGGLPKLLRAPVIGLQLLAMMAFGGRTSLVLTLLLLVGAAVVALTRILRGGRFDILQLGLACLAAPALIAAFVYAASVGFFEPILQRFVEDNGSAKARIIMFRLFDYVSWPDLLFGPDPVLISALQRTEGIEYGIESFWVAFVLMNGLLISGLFFVAMGGFSWRLVRVTRPATITLMIYFYFIASTSVSLSAKTCAFGMVVAMILTMMKMDHPQGPRRPPPVKESKRGSF